MKRKTLAIPIRCVDWSDSSQVVSLFTRDCGLVEGVAKGAHRARNPFQGPFDLAVLYEIVFVERHTSASLAVITEGQVLDGYRGLRRAWPHHVAASLVLELVRLSATAGETHEPLFDLCSTTLAALSSSPPPEVERLLLEFEVRALRILGFLGAVDACSYCGRPWPGGGRPAYFSARAGGLVCRRCQARAGGPQGRQLPGRAVEVLAGLAGMASGAGARAEAPAAVVHTLHGLLLETAVYLLERPLRMVRYALAVA